MNRKAALVVFSGGQDSTTCLFWAKRNFKKVYALSFLYGQKHQKEVELAREIARKAEVEFDVMDVSFIGQLGHNSLTDTTMVMDQEKPADSVPNTFVPGRNLFFLSIAAVYARERGINHLVTGVSQTDFSGYPDCRDAFIKSLNVTLNLAMDEQFASTRNIFSRMLPALQHFSLFTPLSPFPASTVRTLRVYKHIIPFLQGNGKRCGCDSVFSAWQFVSRLKNVKSCKPVSGLQLAIWHPRDDSNVRPFV